jgi:hypothetical protein
MGEGHPIDVDEIHTDDRKGDTQYAKDLHVFDEIQSKF